MSPALRELPVGARQQHGIFGIPSELRTESLWPVGCAGFARYRVHECRVTGTRVVPQRYFYTFVS